MGFTFSHLLDSLLCFQCANCQANWRFCRNNLAVLLGSLILLVMHLFLPQQSQLPDTTKGWSLVIYIAIFPTALAFFAWYDAMAKIELSLLNVMQYLSPIFTIILAMLLLGETMTILNLSWAVLVIIGIAFTAVILPASPEGKYRFKLRSCVTAEAEK